MAFLAGRGRPMVAPTTFAIISSIFWADTKPAPTALVANFAFTI